MARAAALASPACGRSKLAAFAMPPTTADALVLRTYKLGETSRVVVFLTRERGKVRAVAKGARGGRRATSRRWSPLGGAHRASTAARARSCSGWGPASSCTRPSRRERGGWRRRSSCPTWRSCSTRSPRRARPKTRSIGWPVAGHPGGRGGDVATRSSRATLEAWLLRLHGVYPPLDRCAGCGRPLGPGGSCTTMRPTASCARIAGPPRGRCFPRRRARSSRRSFGAPPKTCRGIAPEGVAVLGDVPPDAARSGTWSGPCARTASSRTWPGRCKA